jgi:hypothetical protein
MAKPCIDIICEYPVDLNFTKYSAAQTGADDKTTPTNNNCLNIIPPPWFVSIIDAMSFDKDFLTHVKFCCHKSLKFVGKLID